MQEGLDRARAAVITRSIVTSTKLCREVLLGGLIGPVLVLPHLNLRAIGISLEVLSLLGTH